MSHEEPHPLELAPIKKQMEAAGFTVTNIDFFMGFPNYFAGYDGADFAISKPEGENWAAFLQKEGGSDDDPDFEAETLYDLLKAIKAEG